MIQPCLFVMLDEFRIKVSLETLDDIRHDDCSFVSARFPKYGTCPDGAGSEIPTHKGRWKSVIEHIPKATAILCAMSPHTGKLLVRDKLSKVLEELTKLLRALTLTSLGLQPLKGRCRGRDVSFLSTCRLELNLSFGGRNG